MHGWSRQCSNHVAALLLKIEDVIKIEYNSSTCTLMPCTWKDGCTKLVENAPQCDIKIYLRIIITYMLYVYINKIYDYHYANLILK